jgi:Domain of unknown function (DUF4203)
MEFLYIILGLILLLFGRKLFWVSVGIAGFLVGMRFASLILVDQPPWLLLAVALGAGLLGALIAVLTQRVAFALAGFYGGSYLALIGAQSFGAGGNNIVFFVIGGVVGAVCAALIMDWAIIVISCLAGAGAIVEPLGLGPTMRLIVFLAFVITGASFQSRLFLHSKES